jgi:hypothetical protein
LIAGAYHTRPSLFGSTFYFTNRSFVHPAAATSVEVHLSLAGEYLILEVKDNGQGFNPDQASGKGGLGPPHIGAALICTRI